MSSLQPPARTAAPPAAGLILWLLAAALAMASIWGAVGLLAASWERGDALEVVPTVGALALGVALLAGVVGAAAGGIVARLEARTAPLLPERARWLRLGAWRAIAAALVGGLLWAPLHALGVLLAPSDEVGTHFAIAVASAVAWGPWIAVVLADRREGRALAARQPAGLESVSKLDRVPSVAWLALLVGAIVALPTGLAAAIAVAESDATVGLVAVGAVVAMMAAALALVARVGLFAQIGKEDGTARGLVAMAGAFGPFWAAPYLVALVGGEWLFGGDDTHGPRLFVAVVSATAMLAAIAAVAWARAGAGRVEPARAPADAR